MKNNIINIATIALLSVALLNACKKEDVNIASCSDGIKNQGETETDCGGPCKVCSEINFNSALTYGTVTDIDGNVYKTIKIGTQTWMAENLRVTHYRNGDSIPNVTVNSEWGSKYGAYGNYDNNTKNGTVYGRLYNGGAVKDSRNIAPAGWHVPSDEEWATLISYLGGNSVAGNKMKEVGTKHWESPDSNADNSSGFTALPGGIRACAGGGGKFDDMGKYAYYWSSTENGNLVEIRYLFYSNEKVGIAFYSTMYGLSVRCVKD